MIYIAESGSTKCDAVFLNDDGSEVKRIRTIGFNPYFHSSAFVSEEIQKVSEVQQLGKEVTKVFFFGAGCSSAGLKNKVAEGLKAGFPNAVIEVDHDLQASAYATYNGKPSITCILGTGSNCVYFDGKNIKRKGSGLGFILGDEGSASYIGKKILAGYFYGLMPKEAREDFDKTYNLSKEEIDERVYRSPGVNVFLGNFAPFAHKHIHLPFFYNLVYNGFKEFIATQVITFEESKHVPINFVGSIAHHFSNVLEDVIADFELEMGVIVRRPLDGLIQYLLRYVLKIEKAL